MNLGERIPMLINKIGDGSIRSVAYDTAWAARLKDHSDISSQAIDWLRQNQLADGSWGAAAIYHPHDRFVCTLAAIIALKLFADEQDISRIRGGVEALQKIEIDFHNGDETVGFELVAPALVEEARQLKLVNGNLSLPTEAFVRRERKLKALLEKPDRPTTLGFSAELALSFESIWSPQLRDERGSVSCSPSATVYFLNQISPKDQVALAYLRKIISPDGGLPAVAPFDVFEHGWCLWNLALCGLSLEERLLCEPVLNYLVDAWIPGRGVGFASKYIPDGDDTGMIYEVLVRYGHHHLVDLEAVLYYEEDSYFRCFQLEANRSISANIHIGGALEQANFPFAHPARSKIRTFLAGQQTAQGYWRDKWHTSPYYATSHAIINNVADFERLSRGIIWILKTQREDGSWGDYRATAEETAYALQALAYWRRAYPGSLISDEVLRRGRAWLIDHGEPPYPTLWIGKCLYVPQLVVESAVLSALRSTEMLLQNALEEVNLLILGQPTS